MNKLISAAILSSGLLLCGTAYAGDVAVASNGTVALMCIYAWTIAGMRRVRASHALSRMTPDDGVCDGAATPISSILFPTHADAGFSYHERALTNPILRLNTMSRYMVVLVASVVVPMVVFILKPPNALEPVWDRLAKRH